MSTKDAPPDGSLRVSVRMLIKRKTAVQEQQTVVPASSSVSSAAEEPACSKAAMKMRRYRQRLKEQGKWAEYRQKENVVIKKCKDAMSEEKKELAKEQARVRAQRYREKLKEQGLPVNSTKKKLTRKATEEKRLKDRTRQQKYRENLTPQKKTWINIKRREKRKEKKTADQVAPAPSQPAPSTPALSGRGYSNPSSRLKASKKVRDCLPKSPSKFAAVVDTILKTKSPRKRAALEQVGILPMKVQKLFQSSAEVQRQLESTCINLKKINTKKARQKIRQACCVLLRAKIPKSQIRKRIGISWSVLHSAETGGEEIVNKKRCDAIPPETVEKITKYFCRGDISLEDPLLQNISAKTMEATRFMDKTLKETHEQFCKEHPEIKISFSKFSSLKPKRTKTIAKGKIRACKCEYCCNVELKVEAVNKFLANHQSEGKLGSKYKVMEMTTCALHPDSQAPSKRCLERKCPDCGVGSIRRHLQQALDEHGDKW